MEQSPSQADRSVDQRPRQESWTNSGRRSSQLRRLSLWIRRKSEDFLMREVHVMFSAVFNGLCDIYQFNPQEDDEDEPRNPFSDDREWSEVSTGTGDFSGFLLVNDRLA